MPYRVGVVRIGNTETTACFRHQPVTVAIVSSLDGDAAHCLGLMQVELDPGRGFGKGVHKATGAAVGRVSQVVEFTHPA